MSSVFCLNFITFMLMFCFIPVGGKKATQPRAKVGGDDSVENTDDLVVEDGIAMDPDVEKLECHVPGCEEEFVGICKACKEDFCAVHLSDHCCETPLLPALKPKRTRKKKTGAGMVLPVNVSSCIFHYFFVF